MIYSVELDSSLVSDFQRVLKENGDNETNIIANILKHYLEVKGRQKNKKILDDNMEFLDKKMDEHIDVLNRLRDK